MSLHNILIEVIPVLAAIVESIGIIVIIYGVLRSAFLFIKSGGNLMASNPKMELARALAYSLEFKLAAEILKSVIVQTLDEFLVLGGVVIIRIILTFVIHWEIENNEKSEQVKKMK
ncbi:DUF1622 domain-containing protein [Jeotgalibaca sp. MA1X17-3]|uniref:DUF1622 domain-containing protein n=1 Tax=Jeotgalibaca sp. MA1X17-3 TaxID=2908211 RepID=UPI001F2722B9|nr:DUF1622 domain-containing protein [Jeotgalibaca sp. MA1X17-3]UJF16118.1 DUF1622 domain-containing protein [Jeotgalibaca sp. MA1X17-3]